jgi:hypothetical protein
MRLSCHAQLLILITFTFQQLHNCPHFGANPPICLPLTLTGTYYSEPLDNESLLQMTALTQLTCLTADVRGKQKGAHKKTVTFTSQVCRLHTTQHPARLSLSAE